MVLYATTLSEPLAFLLTTSFNISERLTSPPSKGEWWAVMAQNVIKDTKMYN